MSCTKHETVIPRVRSLEFGARLLGILSKRTFENNTLCLSESSEDPELQLLLYTIERVKDQSMNSEIYCNLEPW